MILTLTQGHQKDYNNLDDHICNFLLYYNDRLHLVTNFTPYKAMMNASVQDFWKNKEKHSKMETKS